MRPTSTSKITPKGLPTAFSDADVNSPEDWEGRSVDWESVVARLVHPVKVAIIEALTRVGRPLSTTEMEALFDDGGLYLSLLSYHARGLVDVGVLEVVVTRQARGALERFYFFPKEK
jgi:hypothetical protein